MTTKTKPTRNSTENKVMSKEEEVEYSLPPVPIKHEEPEEELEIVSTVSATDLDRIFGSLDKLEDATTLVSLTPTYLKLEEYPKGAVFRGVIATTTEIPTQQGGKTTAIVWLDSKGQTYCSAAKLLVDALINQPVGTAFQLVYQGKQKGASGNYFHKLDISLLKL